MTTIVSISWAGGEATALAPGHGKSPTDPIVISEVSECLCYNRTEVVTSVDGDEVSYPMAMSPAMDSVAGGEMS